MKISRLQFFIFLFVTQSGVVFISFQSPLILKAGRDAWVVFIVASFLHYALLLLYERFYRQFKLGPITSWIYKIYWLYLTVSFIAYIDYSLAIWAFPKTPQIIVISIMVGVSLYANLSRAEIAMNISVVLIPMIPLFIFFLLLAWPKYEWTYLFPIGEISRLEWWQGFLKTQFAFLGIELFLIYRRYVVADEKIKGWPLFTYHLVWMLFFCFTVIVSLLFFSLDELKLIPEPLIYILKSQQVTFVERLDLFFIYIWMTWSIITIILFSYTALFIHRLHSKAKRKRDTVIFHLLLLFLPLFFLTKEASEKIEHTLIYVHLFVAIILPFLIMVKNRRNPV